ncbi:uncharacterized protein [Clytia hemisphaerica]|uniref:Uncharacterized protein n=1 Tax=Clytia hemisphaerica TaxID=252671 RepID=A0A7M5WI74_9CNID
MGVDWLLGKDRRNGWKFNSQLQTWCEKMNGFCLILLLAITAWRHVTTSSEYDIYDERDEEQDKGLEYEAMGICASLARCKTKAHVCFTEGNSCDHVCHRRGSALNARNVMRADFYQYEPARYRDAPEGTSPREMYDYMILKGPSVADTYQGAVYKSDTVSTIENLRSKYGHKFCDSTCESKLRQGCTKAGILRNVKNWCLTALDWLGNIPDLEGPSSYVLKVAMDVLKSRNLDLTEGAFVAAAATSAFLTADWWGSGDTRFADEFGFAVQHSLWLAIFAGRLRITLQPKFPLPLTQVGSSISCDLQAAENFELETGSVYASLCTFLDQNTHMRFRPEIHTRNSVGCVEKTTGMVYIRVGDWVKSGAKTSCIGGAFNKYGITFYDSNELTPVEVTIHGTTLFPPSIKESLKDMRTTQCTTAKGNGPNEKGILGKCGLQTVGGICNWFPVW